MFICVWAGIMIDTLWTYPPPPRAPFFWVLSTQHKQQWEADLAVLLRKVSTTWVLYWYWAAKSARYAELLLLLLLRVERISVLAVFCGFLLPCFPALPLDIFHVFLTCFQSFFLSLFFSLIYLRLTFSYSRPATVYSLPVCRFFTLGFVLPSLTSFYQFVLFSFLFLSHSFSCHSLIRCWFCYCIFFLLKSFFSPFCLF